MYLPPESLPDCNNQYWYFHLGIPGIPGNSLVNQQLNYQEGVLQPGSESCLTCADAVPQFSRLLCTPPEGTMTTRSRGDHTCALVTWGRGEATS